MTKIQTMPSRLALVVGCMLWAQTAASQVETAPGIDCNDILARAASDPRATVLEGLIGGCGPKGRAVIASVVANANDVTDESLFTRLRDIVPRGGTMLSATLGLAVNAHATVIGRVGGLRLLTTQLLGKGGDLMTREGPIGPQTAGLGCFAQVIGIGDKAILGDDPLPPDYRSRIRVASERIAREPAVDPAVRRAALCLRRHFSPLPPEPVEPSVIAFSNVCERMFQVTNRGKEAVTLWYDVAGKPGRTQISAPVGNSFIGTQYPGHVRVYDHERVIASANSSGKRCPVTRGTTERLPRR